MRSDDFEVGKQIHIYLMSGCRGWRWRHCIARWSHCIARWRWWRHCIARWRWWRASRAIGRGWLVQKGLLGYIKVIKGRRRMHICIRLV